MSTLNLTRSLCALAFMASVLSACGGGDDGVVGTGFGGGPGTGTVEVTGTAQKGPYLKGSEVLVSALSATGVPSPDTTLSEIQDDMGTFVFQVAQAGPVLIATDGYHFNEITGSLSQGRLLLRAVYNATADAQQNAYVNVLTHLTYKRTLTLLAQGVPVVDAIRQAETEVLQALRTVFPISDVTDFTQLSIYNTDTSHAIGNAYVLALSATVYQAAMLRQTQTPESSVDAQLTAILNTLSDDIADDASVADATILSELITASHKVRPDQVRANLEARSLAIVLETLPVADLDLFIDSDGDGVVNVQDGDDDNDGVVDALDDSPYVYSEAPVLVPTAVTTGIASNTPFTLQWTTSEFASQIEVQMAKDTSFGEVITSALTTSSSFDGMLSQGVYFLRARAQSTLGGWGPWSATTQIPVDAFAKAFINADARDQATAVIQTSDGGFLIVGSTKSTDAANLLGSIDGFIAKLDALGQPEWRKEIVTSDEDTLSDPYEIPAGAYLMLHGREDLTTSQKRMSITKISGSGEILWELDQGLSPHTLDNGAKVLHYIAEDDGIVVGSTLRRSDALIGVDSRYDITPRVVKLASDGQVLWSYDLDDSLVNFEDLTGLWKAPTGGYTISGNIYDPAIVPPCCKSKSRPFVASLSADRAQLDVVADHVGLFTYGTHAVPLNDGGYVLVGNEGDVAVNYDNAILYRFAPNGELRFHGYTTDGCACHFFTHLSNLLVADDKLLFGNWAVATGDHNDQWLEIIEASQHDGSLIARHQYRLDTPGYSYKLGSYASTSDKGLVILGDLKSTAGTPLGYILVRTDAQKIAPTALSTMSVVAPR